MTSVIIMKYTRELALIAQKLMIHILLTDILKMISKRWNTLAELIHLFKLDHVHLAWTHPHVNFC
ncbi:hypothetical protein [Lactococcus lactis]|uniref:hypothetical protein n=1 Tax=Lactococcus lactis TaxID=1358 RepID=UPI00190FED9B|nr:hypothetical protein [Lactococcus lactis]QQE99470.1 hypothetical protein LacL0098_08110 [Lactococcus lactis]